MLLDVRNAGAGTGSDDVQSGAGNRHSADGTCAAQATLKQYDGAVRLRTVNAQQTLAYSRRAGVSVV